MSKKKKSSSSKSSFNAKNFFIMHVEKLVFAFIALLAGLVVYSGFSAKPFSSAKTPQKLQEQAKQVSLDIKKDHWDAMASEEGRNVAPVFVQAARESRKPLDPIQYGSDIRGTSSIKPGARRSDPALAAPEKLEAHYFYGAIARTANVDPLEILEDAKKPEVRVPRNNNDKAGYPGGTSSSSSMSGGPGMAGGGPGMAGGGPGMMGGGDGYGGMGTDPSLIGRRLLSAGYDRGYTLGMRTFFDAMGSGQMGQTGYMGTTEGLPPTGVKPDVATKKIIAAAKGFVSVTALAPHEEMETSYRKEFYTVQGYMEGRDTPNYVGFEVQRVEVIDPNKEIDDSDWKPLPEASPTTFKEFIKKLPGTCSEVHLTHWVEPNISMPIPPILLTDYRKYASHSQIPTGAFEESEAAGASGTSGMYGMSGMSGMGGGYPGGGAGMPSDGGFTEGGNSGYPMGGGGMGGPGYPGGGSGGPGYPGGGSSSSGYPGGGSSSSGYPGGGSSSSGYPGGSGMAGTGGGYSDGGNSGFMDLPKKLPSTKYKLVRFYDFTVQPGKVYKYRVRLLMYDSNYPEWASIKPASSTLATDVLKRVRTLESQEPKDAGVATKPVTGAAGPTKRASRRETEWSAPSQAVLTAKPASVFVARGEDKLECVFVDFDATRGIGVPRKEHLDQFSRGLVFGMPTKAKGKETPVEIIHPVKKVIKALKDFKTTNLVTIVDIKGYSPLTMGNASKDPIKTGAEVISFDPSTGQIVVSREFDNFTNFHMVTQPDSPAVGPLGGGLSFSSSTGTPGYGAGGGAGSEMDGGMGPAGMNPGMGGLNPGGGSPGGAAKKGLGN